MSITSEVQVAAVLKEQPRVNLAAGATLELLVVAADEYHCAGVDTTSGALLRTWSPTPSAERIRPYDLVEVTVDADFDSVPDPTQPEALGVTGPPRRVSRLRGRQSERLLKPLLHPDHQTLLGVPASVIPFWERRSDHPSVAVVEPTGPVLLVREGSYTACRFAWQGHLRELPCLDRAMAAHMDRTGRARLAAPRGARLVVAITPPIEGRCHKVVETVLLRP